MQRILRVCCQPEDYGAECQYGRCARRLIVCVEMIRATLIDAAGTLCFLTKTVGHHYTYVGREVGLDLDAQDLDRAFHAAWLAMPQRFAIDGPREDDDKGWWRELVGRVFDQVAPSLSEFDRDNFFEVAYEHFAEPGVWELYPEVPGVLKQLQKDFQLAVISNFDGRLRFILQPLTGIPLQRLVRFGCQSDASCDYSRARARRFGVADSQSRRCSSGDRHAECKPKP